MKGTAEQPMCGFSARVIQILTHLNVPFKDINILADEAMRQGIKDFSNWPTVPQVYIDGEFVGGCDIVTEMFTDGELKEILIAKNII
jgi:monothiol glutaredoxin